MLGERMGRLRRLQLFTAAPPAAMCGLGVLTVYGLVALFAPVLAPHGETEIVGGVSQPSNIAFLLGTDSLGRDTLSRLIFGARNTIGLAALITGAAFVIGGLPALIMTSIGGWADQIVGRVVDVLMAIPPLIVALFFLTVLGNSIPVLVIVVALVESTRVFRLTRGLAQDIVAMDFIEAAKLRGESFWRVAYGEVLPNAIPPLIAEFGLRFCFVFLLISALSFLGLGIQPPTAVWGSMVRDDAMLITFGDIKPLFPAAAIGVLVIAVNLVVDWAVDVTSRVNR